MTRKLTAANENKEMEKIEGDTIPGWEISDEKEDDNDYSLFDKISTEIDGGNKVLSVLEDMLLNY